MTDHGAAGFCTDHGQAETDRVIEALSKCDERCRDHGDHCRRHLIAVFPNYGADCTCGLAALDDETARLRAEVERFSEDRDQYRGQITRLFRERDEARAEVERLRAGIAHIVDRYGNAPGIETCATMYDLRRLARVTP